MDQCDTLDVTAKRKVPEMPIKITRIETLALMQELPANHFLQSRLVDELVELNKSASARYGDREVIGGELVVTRSENALTAEFVTPTKRLGIKSDYDGSMGQYTDAQLEEMYESAPVSPDRQCKWVFYGHQCTTTSKNEFCDEHNGKTCSHRDSDGGAACGKPADHGCPTELQFVCGFPCCAEHSNCGHYRR